MFIYLYILFQRMFIGLRCSSWYLFFFIQLLVGDSFSQSTSAWPRHIIDNSSSGADGVKLADINQDGKLDIVTGWEEGGITKVYFRPAKENLKKNWPSVIVGQTPSVEDAVFADINRDGKLDVVSCTEGKSKKIFFHLSPSQNLAKAKKWKQRTLPISNQLMQWMYAEPIQLDGKNGIDLVVAGKGKNAKLGWLQAPAKRKKMNAWTWHSISSVGWIMSIELEDMDKDGDTDIVITDRKGDLQGGRWLENLATEKEPLATWRNHFFGAQGLEVMFMTLADLDGDNNKEIILCERSEQTIRIFKNTAPKNLPWEEQIIPLPHHTGKAKSVAVGDLNQDGVPDFVISTNTYKKEIDGLIWMDGRQLNSKEGQRFHSISGAHHAKFDKVILLDLDEDGDLDVLTCEENFGEKSEGLGVVWYENILKHKKN